MPSTDNIIENISELAFNKQESSRKQPFNFFVKTFFAGIFIVIAVIISYCVGALLFPIDAAVAKIGTAFTFSIALMLIIFIGGELFTGANLVMGIGFFNKRCSLTGMLRVWLYCWIGNFIACVIFGVLFTASGVQADFLRVFMTATVIPKLNLDPLIAIIRGMFANFCVCCGILASFKMKSESAKIIIIIFCVFTFIFAGFEHSVANMGIFTIASFYAEGFSFAGAFSNLLFSTIGNIIGGMFMLGLPFYYINKNNMTS